jgi:hypothetical protein
MAFELAEIAVGGGVLGLCPLPQAGDVAVLQAWHPNLVLTLVERTEAAELSPDLCAALAGRGIAQRWFEIADYSTPQADWGPLSVELNCILRAGGRVVIHCRGGCGRTGMIALRLMEEVGEVGALARLRAVRPCAVETEAQMAWALQGR